MNSHLFRLKPLSTVMGAATSPLRATTFRVYTKHTIILCIYGQTADGVQTLYQYKNHSCYASKQAAVSNKIEVCRLFARPALHRNHI
jgi:hypothetical protein